MDKKTEEIQGLLQSLKSASKWNYCELGYLTSSKSKEQKYIVLLDSKAIIIENRDTLETFPISNLYLFSGLLGISSNTSFSEYVFFPPVDPKQNKILIENLTNYKDRLAGFEKVFLEELDLKITALTEDMEIKKILINFLNHYLRENLKNVEQFFSYEEQLLSYIFWKGAIDSNFGRLLIAGVEPKFGKLVDLLIYKGLISNDGNPEESLLLVIKSLRKIALNYYSNEFKKEYGTYFTDIDTLSIDECIEIYFSIDFIQHNEIDNIGYFTYFLYNHKTLLNKNFNNSLLEAFYQVKDKIYIYQKNAELLQFEKKLLNMDAANTLQMTENITIEEVDFMNGREFEKFISDLFKSMGYKSELTPSSGDQGVDIIVTKKGIRTGIQVKCYSTTVSNKAIQEIAAGVRYYDLSKALVITNNYFTKSAKDLAIANDVILWDRSILIEKMNGLYN